MNMNVLIDEVFARPALWNRFQKHHHNRFVLDKLWDEVAAKLHTSRVCARNKWKNLRDRFRATIKSEDPERYTGEWKYFYSLMFLKDQFIPRDQDSYTQRESQGDTGFRISPGSPNYDIEFPPLSSSPLPSNSSTEQPKRKRSEPVDMEEDEECEYLKEKRPRCEEEEDEDLNFFKSVLPHIRNLTPYDKMEYRIKVMKLTQEFLISDQNTSYPATTNAPNLGPSSSVNGATTTDTYSLDEFVVKLESDT